MQMDTTDILLGIGSQAEVRYDMRDMSTEPPPVECSCGELVRYKRVQPMRRRDPSSHWMWSQPQVSPCRVCQPTHEAREAQRRRLKLQKVQGLPRKHWRWSLDRITRPTRAEVEEGTALDYAKRVIRQNETPDCIDGPLMAAHQGNIDAIRAAERWVERYQQGKGAGWMMLHGPVGTGKSAIIAAMCNAALDGARLTVARVDGSRVTWCDHRDGRGYRMQSPPTAWTGGSGVVPYWSSEGELYTRMELSWSGDRDPLRKVTQAPLLFLDDLGEVRNDAARKMIERLISYRYDHGLATVISTNLTMEDIERGQSRKWSEGHVGFGARVADRLREMCGKDIYEVRTVAGLSFRQIGGERCE